MAARIRRELGADVQMVSGRYGEFKVLVDGLVVASNGPMGFLGVLPSAARVVKAVRERAAR